MATIFVEGKSYQVKDGQNLLQACLSLGYLTAEQFDAIVVPAKMLGPNEQK